MAPAKRQQSQATATTTCRDVYIVDGIRTPFLKAKLQPGSFPAADLAWTAASALKLRLPITPDKFDEVIIGCVMPSAYEANIARIVALRLGCGVGVPAWTVQRNCASGLQALDNAMQSIASGRANLVLAGGVEAMSHAPLLISDGMTSWLGQWRGAKTWQQRLRVLRKFSWRDVMPVPALVRGLTDPVVGMSMGQTAERLAYDFNISRDAMDQFAFQSHHRALQAREHLAQEITPLYDDKGKCYQVDEGVRDDSTVEKLSTLKPYFDYPYGSVTAGNSSQISDGAAMLLLASAEAVTQYQLPVLGKIIDVQWAGLDPECMGLGPIHAMTPILQRQAMTLAEIDYWEMNEAFAAQVLACVNAWEDADFCRKYLGLNSAMGRIPHERLNSEGGAISIGHPVGASGARLVLHLLHLLKRQQSRYGMASLCIGGGQGGAMLLESREGV